MVVKNTRMMMTRLFLTICFGAISVIGSAKGKCGIYLTAADFADKKVAYMTASKVLMNNSVLELPYVTIVENGNKIKLPKDKVYGYVAGDNKAYRFYKKEEYQVAGSAGLTIYIRIERIAQSKGFKVKKNFYFSTSPDGDIVPLTFERLKNAYRNNDKFLDLLDQYFGNGDATAYDDVHKVYKINYVFTKSIGH